MPESLSRAIASRMSFETASLEYKSRIRSGVSGQVWESRFEVQLTRNEIYWHDKGDDDGVVLKDPRTGRPLIGVKSACSPDHTIRDLKTGEEWFRREGEPRLYVNLTENAPNKWRLSDPRAFGISWENLGDLSPDKWLIQLQLKEAAWSERKSNGFIEVRMQAREADSSKAPFSQIVWTIDPSKDDAIIEVRKFMIDEDGNRTLKRVVKNDYVKEGTRWWLIRSYSESPTLGMIFSHEFSKAEFDKSSHHKHLDADNLAMPMGVQTLDFRRLHEGLKGADSAVRYIGGGVVVSEKEWRDDFANPDDLKFLQDFERNTRLAFGNGQYPQWWNSEADNFGLHSVSWTPDLWETYVRRWILRYSPQREQNSAESSDALSSAQIESAWGILKDCRKRAKPILLRMSKKFEQKVESLNSQTATSKPASADSSDEKELGRIFDDLKSRLQRTLRTKQVSSGE
ncbi:MAG: hypothetical protein IPK83_01120 [Planctomycetes bacterium]|nr:hypothetical protein [Planctomycetota bacterium]